MKKKASANLHIRLPSALKREAELVLAALGLDTSSAIRLFYAQIALQQSIPFTLPKLRAMSPKTRKIVAEAIRDEDAIGPFADAESALNALHAAT
ncbi:MAG: type II toxin-antitoxin system RelB/DinJ family antitoxin [Candidatus Peregrinibacteria bacterium]